MLVRKLLIGGANRTREKTDPISRARMWPPSNDWGAAAWLVGWTKMINTLDPSPVARAASEKESTSSSTANIPMITRLGTGIFRSLQMRRSKLVSWLSLGVLLGLFQAAGEVEPYPGAGHRQDMLDEAGDSWKDHATTVGKQFGRPPEIAQNLIPEAGGS